MSAHPLREQPQLFPADHLTLSAQWGRERYALMTRVASLRTTIQRMNEAATKEEARQISEDGLLRAFNIKPYDGII